MHEQRFIFLYRRPIQSFPVPKDPKQAAISARCFCNPSDLWRQISTKNEQEEGRGRKEGRKEREEDVHRYTKEAQQQRENGRE